MSDRYSELIEEEEKEDVRFFAVPNNERLDSVGCVRPLVMFKGGVQRKL